MTTPRRPGQWRWVAHPPWRPPLPVRRPPPPRSRSGPAWSDRAPSYPATPRWGLPLVVASPSADGAPGRSPARLASAAPVVLRSARTWFLAAAAVHVVRYALLVYYAERVTPWWVEAASTALVWIVGLVALVAGAAAVVTATAWLVESRRRVFAPSGDPRRPVTVWAGCLIPVVTYLRAPVYLEELRRASPRASSRNGVHRWWAVWVLNGFVALLALWRGTVDGPQAAADTVLLAALAALAGAWAIRETQVVARDLDERPPQAARRFVVQGIEDSPAEPEPERTR